MLELLAEGSGGESHRLCYVADGKIGLILKKADGVLQTQIVDVGSEGLAAGICCEKIVHSVSVDVETVYDVLPLQINESLFTGLLSAVFIRCIYVYWLSRYEHNKK